MACKPKSQLRMADGGELMRRFANRQPVRMLDGTPENMAQNTTPMSAQDAGAFAAMGGPQGVAPDAPAAAPAADPGRRQRKLAAGQRTQTFMPTMGNIQTEVFDPHIRQLALRDGGTVPGKGTGDKIPALYEPGEFVVSNDMLDAEPGLREQLHDLRGNVLAAKGKSVEQADAQAMKGGTLRAASGGALPKLPSLDFLDKRPAPAPAPIQAALRTPAQVPVVRSAIADAMERAVSKHPMGWQAAPAAPNFETLPGAAGPNNSIKFAVPPEPVNATTSLGANTAEARGMTRTAPAPNLTAMNQPGVDSRNAQFAERSAYEARAAREANPRSMTTKELFSRGDGSVRGSSPLRFNPPGMGPNGVVQTANAPRSMTRAELFNQPKSSIPNNPAGPPNAPPGYRAGQKFTSGLKFAGKVAPMVGAAIEAGDVYDVAKDPNTTKIDVGTQAAEGVSKLAGATAGGLAGAAAGGPFAPLTGLVGGIAGYYAPELVTKGLRWATGHDTASPIDRVRAQESAKAATPAAVPVTTPAAAKPVAAPAPAVAPGLQAVTPEDHATSDRLINSALYNRPRTGMIPGGVDQNGLKYGETWDEGNMNTLRTDGSSLKKYNAGLAARGAGIQVTKDANGQLRLSNSTGPEKMRYVGADGVPTNQYERTNQYAEGQQQLAAARASLRNPDGSQWSARDNAVMAANLRDGVDPYRGTSRAPKEEDRIPAIGEFGHNRAVAAKAERERNKTMLRGQDLDMQRAHAQTSATLRKNEFDMQRDIRKDSREQEAHDQAIGDKAREGIAKEFTVYDTDKDGRQVANPAASAASLDALRSILPGMTSTDPKTREAALSDAKAMHGIFLRARSQDPVGWEAMKFWQPKRPALSGMPDATESSTKQLSGLDGLLTMNAENGDTILRQKDGREINLGPLDSRQRKLLEDAQQRGWGK